jgi:hypothetical protein
MGEVEVGEGGSKEEEEGRLVEVTTCAQCITRTNVSISVAFYRGLRFRV